MKLAWSSFMAEWSFWVLALGTVAAVMVSVVVLRRLVAWLQSSLHSQKNRRVWSRWVNVLAKPLEYQLVIMGAALLLCELPGAVRPTALVLAKGLAVYGSLLNAVWCLFRMVSAWEATWVRHAAVNSTEKGQRFAIVQLVRITLVMLSLLTFMEVAGLPIKGILTFGGVGGIGVALAAKDMLGNLFGGLFLFLDQPFSVGDWIRSPDRDIEGTVEKIGLRMTVIRTFDKRLRYIPNGLFSNIVLENPSRMSHRRIMTTLGLRYEDATKVAKVASEIETMLIEHPEIDENVPPIVDLTDLNESSLDLLIKAFVTTTDANGFYRVQQDVLLKVLEIVASNGAACAFPSRTVEWVMPPALARAALNEN